MIGVFLLVRACVVCGRCSCYCVCLLLVLCVGFEVDDVATCY